MEQVKHWVDALSIGTLVAAIVGILPAIATAASLIWSCIRIFETKTVQRWLKGDKYDRRGRP